MRFLEKLLSKQPEQTGNSVEAVLRNILGKRDEGVYELTKQVKALVDTEDAPENLKQQIRELKKELSKVSNELEDVKSQKVRELQDVQHLVKIKKEQLDIEHDKKVLKLEAAMKDKELTLTREHNDAFIRRIDAQAGEMAAVHMAVLNRLPNVGEMVKITAQAGVQPDTIVNEAE